MRILPPTRSLSLLALASLTGLAPALHAQSLPAPQLVAEQPQPRATPARTPEPFQNLLPTLLQADFDRDGQIELIWGPAWREQLYETDGQGNYWPWTQARLPSDEQGVPVAAADMNGDGAVDLIYGGRDTSWPHKPVAVFLGDGRGHFSTSPLLGPSLARGHEACLGDVDLDGDLDVVLFDRAKRTAHLLLNDGKGQLSTAPGAFPALSEHAIFVDVDGDKDLDLVAPMALGSAQVLINQGAATFVDASALLMPADTSTRDSVVALDMDQDGDQDLVFGVLGGVDVYQNDGSGSFSKVAFVPLEPGLSYALLSSDVDGDRVDDLWARPIHPENRYGELRLLRCDGQGGFQDMTTGTLGQVRCATPRSTIWSFANAAMRVADLDGDGREDLLLNDAFETVWLRKTPSGSFAKERGNRVPETLDASRYVMPFDMDGDGDPDYLVLNQPHVRSSGAHRLVENLGHGRFRDVSSTHLPGAIARSECGVAADFDQDGDVDVFVSNHGPAQLLFNDGSGRFRDATAGRLPSLLNAAAHVVGTDVDGDGDVDLILAMNGTQNLLLLNDGKGSFGDASAQLPQAADATAHIAVIDYEGDGDPDLFVSNTDRSGLALLNDGKGTFREATLSVFVSGLAQYPLGAAVLDVDADRDLDLLIWSRFSIDVYRNDGKGQLSMFGGYGHSLLSGVDRFVPVDINADGLEDVVFSASSASGVAALVQQAGGLFQTASIGADAPRTAFASVAAADFDQDQDADLLVVGDWELAPDAILWGLRQQLHLPHLPRLGARLRISVHALALGNTQARPVLPMLSWRAPTSGVSLGDWGRFYLDPQALLVLPIQNLVGLTQERIDFDLLIPQDPNFVGVDLSCQALILHEAYRPSSYRLSNAATLRIRN
jgi:hypothetical protein